jgi:hypothetical protein
MNYSKTISICLTGVMLFGCSVTTQTSSPKTQGENAKVRNECVHAGFPTGGLGTQERCWTPDLRDAFVKGLKPTIQQGAYGTVILRTGNCMPRIVGSAESSDPCRYRPVDRRIYIFDYADELPLRRPTDKELILKSYQPIKFIDTNSAFYQVELPVGRYTLMAKDEGTLYPGGLVIFEPGKRKETQLIINRASD